MKLPFGLTGVWGYVAAGVAILALVASIIFGVNSCKKIDQANNNALVEQGVVKERDQGKTEVLNHVEQARDATDNPTSNELNVVCEKYDRNCKNSK